MTMTVEMAAMSWRESVVVFSRIYLVSHLYLFLILFNESISDIPLFNIYLYHPLVVVSPPAWVKQKSPQTNNTNKFYFNCLS